MSEHVSETDNGKGAKDKRSFWKHEFFIPALVFLALLGIFYITTQVSGNPPQIAGITPEIANPGQVIVITGTNFGEKTQNSYIIVAERKPTSSHYIEWTNTRISLRIPEQTSSGLIHVITQNGQSNPVLFTNSEELPQVATGPVQPGEPYIENISPSQTSVGSTITITGRNFGTNRANSKVYFSWYATRNEDMDRNTLDRMLPARERDYDYLSWNDNQITVRVPDGAGSGNVLVAKDESTSNAVFFEVTEKAGSKQYVNPRTYAIHYTVDISNIKSNGDNTLYLWVPLLDRGPIQRGIQAIKQEPTPFFENYNNLMMYQFENLEDKEKTTIRQTFMFDRYETTTDINPSMVATSYSKDTQFYRQFTSANSYIPSDEERISNTGRYVIGSVTNPYWKARRIYDYLLDHYTFTTSPETNNLMDSFKSQEADSYIYSILFCAFARNTGVPARPVAGYIINDSQKAIPHYWAEFYVSNFGWIPIDPALGDGATYDDTFTKQNASEYYFGNVENQHIAFSRGVLEAKQMDPYGIIKKRNRMYSLQTIHEEKAGKLENYTVNWNDIIITGVY